MCVFFYALLLSSKSETENFSKARRLGGGAHDILLSYSRMSYPFPTVERLRSQRLPCGSGLWHHSFQPKWWSQKVGSFCWLHVTCALIDGRPSIIPLQLLAQSLECILHQVAGAVVAICLQDLSHPLNIWILRICNRLRQPCR